MSRPVGVLRRPSASPPELGVPDVVDLLASIVRSVEPAVVFSSVAQLCVPRVSSRVRIAVSEGGKQNYLIALPLGQAIGEDVDGDVAFGGIRVDDDSVVTEFHGDAVGVHPAYRGVLVLPVEHSAPTDALIGQLVVDHAVAVIAQERLAAAADAQEVRADNLERAMQTSREIGIAMGIVMSRNTLTQDQAFDRLRLLSQDTNRKVRDIALDVIEDGDLDVLDFERTSR